MESTYFISISDICASHDIEPSFVVLLHNYGLIEVTDNGDNRFIPAEQLEAVEKYIHLHYDLDINIEGIETIVHLLSRIIQLQNEIASLKNRLRLYEGDAE